MSIVRGFNDTQHAFKKIHKLNISAYHIRRTYMVINMIYTHIHNNDNSISCNVDRHE